MPDAKSVYPTPQWATRTLTDKGCPELKAWCSSTHFLSNFSGNCAGCESLCFKRLRRNLDCDDAQTRHSILLGAVRIVE